MTGNELRITMVKHNNGHPIPMPMEALDAVAAELDRIKEFQIDAERKAAILEGLTLAYGTLEEKRAYFSGNPNGYLLELIAEKRMEFGV